MFAEAMRELEARKIDFDLTPPSDKLEPLPTNLNDLGGPKIMHYFQNTLKWWQHVAGVDAEVDAHLVEVQANMENIKARCKKTGVDPELNPEYVEWKRKATKYKIQQKMLEPKKSSLSKQMAIVSRSVEVLKTDWQGTVRSETLNRRPGAGRGGQLPPL